MRTYRFFLASILSKRFRWMILIGVGNCDGFLFKNKKKKTNKLHEKNKRQAHISL